MIAGAGGLGTNVSQHLVRWGIGSLHIVDTGTIDEPDLNRQVLFFKKDIGRKKVEVAKERLDTIGLITKIFIYDINIDESFVLPEGINGVIDCLDNFETRYILDDKIHKKGIFLIHGGVYGLCRQITSVVPGKTPCLREIFSNIKGDGETIPVAVQTPAVVASLQVTEAINLICNREKNLTNKLLFIDLNDYSFKKIELNL